MKVGHCQLACQAGDYEANIQKVLAGLAEADAQGIDIVSFPESFLTGYFPSEDEARAHSFAVDGAEVRDFLARTAAFACTFMVGFNEMRGQDVYNTVLVVEGGKLLGTYSKAFPVCAYFTPGRQFPVFERAGVKFGVIICADGGHIEPSRILALKGARIIFAPHYNNIAPRGLINHARKVRADHTARAVENGVWFLRGNNVESDSDRQVFPGAVGYGASYLLDTFGEIVCRSQRLVECMISAEVDLTDYPWEEVPFFTTGRRESLASAKALGKQFTQTLLDLDSAP
jgi:predicted amidohydrolase